MQSLLPLCLSVVGLVALGGCAATSPLACPKPGNSSRSAQVFFATDRERASKAAPASFGPERSDPPRLHLGWERVALGPGHRIGRLDAAVAITPESQQTSAAVVTQGEALRRSDADISEFVSRTVRPAIRATSVSRKGAARKVLLYIHGYRNSFDEAVRKTAQLAGDLGLVTCGGEARGLAIAYSWPSEGALLSYLADEENAEWTQQRLAPFLEAIARACREERAELHIIAHSMGARALIRSLADLSNSANGRRGRLADNVVLLAPDIGKGLFDQYVERFLPLVDHLTIYVSASDRALSLSRLLHGGHRRVGLLESSVLTALELTGIRFDDHRELGYQTGFAGDPRVDMIDVTESFTSQFGHSYDDPGFIRDLSALIHDDTPPGTGARSNLQRKPLRPGFFRTIGPRQLNYYKLTRSRGN